jgi:hypothetical protein
MFSILICRECNARRVRSDKAFLVGNFVWLGIGLLLGILVFIGNNKPGAPVFADFWWRQFLGLSWAGFALSWRYMNHQFFNRPGEVFVVGSSAWFYKWVGAAIGAFLIGSVMLPWVTYITLKRWPQVKEAERAVQL